MSTDKPSVDRMCREALERLHRSIGTKAGIAKAAIRKMAQRIRERAIKEIG